MTRRTVLLTVGLCVLSAVIGWAGAQQPPAGGQFPQFPIIKWTWPDSLDAVAAAPKNHKVLYENDHIRLLEVTVQPGETENYHGHKDASVFLFDAPLPKGEDAGTKPADRQSDAPAQNGVRTNGRLMENAQFPFAAAVPSPQAPHAVHNIDTFPMHFYRMEFKKIDGLSIEKKTSY